MSLETNRVIRPKSYTYQKYIDEVTTLEPGVPMIIDNIFVPAFRTTLIEHIRRLPVNKNVRYKSLTVSKNKTYFFKVDKSKPLT